MDEIIKNLINNQIKIHNTKLKEKEDLELKSHLYFELIRLFTRTSIVKIEERFDRIVNILESIFGLSEYNYAFKNFFKNILLFNSYELEDNELYIDLLKKTSGLLYEPYKVLVFNILRPL